MALIHEIYKLSVFFVLGNCVAATGGECGRKPPRFIHDGEHYMTNLESDSWPWVGSLRNKFNEHLCAAVLLSFHIALSTASCFDFENDIEEDTLPTLVVFGSGDKRVIYASYQHISTFDVIVHPMYDNRDGFDHDIAVLKLHDPVGEYSSYVSPVCVDSEKIEEDVFEQCTMTGWGRTGDLTTVDDLQSAGVSIRSPIVCEAIYGSFNNRSFLCVSQSSDICSNDPGSPLLCRTPTGQWTLVGLSSYETEFCDFQPVGYTRISSYLDFVQENEASISTLASPITVIVTLLSVTWLKGSIDDGFS